MKKKMMCFLLAAVLLAAAVPVSVQAEELEGEKCGSIAGSVWQPKECLSVYYYTSDHPTYAECSQDHTEGSDKYGYITEEQMSKRETYVNFDFEETWTMVEFLGHPYHTALVSSLEEEPQEEDPVVEDATSEDTAEGNQPAESKPESTEQKADAEKGSGEAPIFIVAGVAAVGAGVFFGMKKMKKIKLISKKE